jgi:hypothetical protein
MVCARPPTGWILPFPGDSRPEWPGDLSTVLSLKPLGGLASDQIQAAGVIKPTDGLQYGSQKGGECNGYMASTWRVFPIFGESGPTRVCLSTTTVRRYGRRVDSRPDECPRGLMFSRTARSRRHTGHDDQMDGATEPEWPTRDEVEGRWRDLLSERPPPPPPPPAASSTPAGSRPGQLRPRGRRRVATEGATDRNERTEVGHPPEPG